MDPRCPPQIARRTVSECTSSDFATSSTVSSSTSRPLPTVNTFNFYIFLWAVGFSSPGFAVDPPKNTTNPDRSRDGKPSPGIRQFMFFPDLRPGRLGLRALCHRDERPNCVDSSCLAQKRQQQLLGAGMYCKNTSAPTTPRAQRQSRP
jgi:hypothetical protein